EGCIHRVVQRKSQRSKQRAARSTLAAVRGPSCAAVAGFPAQTGGASPRGGAAGRGQVGTALRPAVAITGPTVTPVADTTSYTAVCRTRACTVQASARANAPLATLCVRGAVTGGTGGDRQHNQRDRLAQIADLPGAGCHAVVSRLALLRVLGHQ